MTTRDTEITRESVRCEQTGRGCLDRRAFLGATALAAGTIATARPSSAFAQGGAQSGPRRMSTSPVIETSAGRVRGAFDGTVYSFKGVPYGASTAGGRRFQPPETPEPWTGVREALALGLRCPTRQSTAQAEYVVLDRREPAGEDCLVLNIWTRGLRETDKRPVMLWLHGGGFSGGSGGPVLYDGTNLADRHDVVIVSANHRLNLWGYLHLAETGLARFERTSNVGMLDIVVALEWIRDNIENFGGDPDRVTVFGQSGGGSKTSTLLGMPGAKGLFHRAIVMSGSQVRSATQEDAARNVETFLAALDLRPQQAEQLLDIPYYDLREALGRGNFDWGPVVDGDTVPDHNFDPIATPISADVPMMIGSNETEITWRVQQHYDPLDDATLLVYAQRALESDEATAREVVAVYREGRPEASNLDLYLILASDLSGFRIGTDTQAERKAEQGEAPVYKYYFDWYSPVAGGIFRAMHLMELPFVFDNTELSSSLVGEGPELRAMADRIAGAFAEFARTGNPNRPGSPTWLPFDTDRRATMFLNENMQLVNDPYRRERIARVDAARRS
jgi:para-nitrobenzyl esterase